MIPANPWPTTPKMTDYSAQVWLSQATCALLQTKSIRKFSCYWATNYYKHPSTLWSTTTPSINSAEDKTLKDSICHKRTNPISP
ncbi:hypothetical protein GDO81_022356 [Engystomops pustulosus]|uniref:Uncharacterized protein n=1 Tax=Engystomops pustulosus TaxID=76066 RepID=A0AAV6YUL8_ENGPU|nr:hypothetical protein GDO81_022356 [Engystomops pustulosus]